MRASHSHLRAALCVQLGATDSPQPQLPARANRPACTANAAVNSAGPTTSIATSNRPNDAASAPHDHDPTSRVHSSSSTAVTVPSPAEGSTSRAGACRSTVPRQGHSFVAGPLNRAETNASTSPPGTTLGTKGAPCGTRGRTRSAENSRQSSRSRPPMTTPPANCRSSCLVSYLALTTHPCQAVAQDTSEASWSIP